MVIAVHPAARLASPASPMPWQYERSRVVIAVHPAARFSSAVSPMLQYERSRVVIAVHPAARFFSAVSPMLQQHERSRVVIAVHPAARLASPVSVIFRPFTHRHHGRAIWATASMSRSPRVTHLVSAGMQAPAGGASALCHKRPASAILFSTAFPPLALILARIARQSSPGSEKMSLVVVMSHLLILQLESTSLVAVPLPAPNQQSKCSLLQLACSSSGAVGMVFLTGVHSQVYLYLVVVEILIY